MIRYVRLGRGEKLRVWLVTTCRAEVRIVWYQEMITEIAVG
jgi:hypothetical protein